MMFKVEEGKDDVRAGADDALLRLFKTDCAMFSGDTTEAEPSKDGWRPCKKEEIGDWSALCYHVGNILRKEYNIAVGMIICGQGASVIESWLPESVFEKYDFIRKKDKLHGDHYAEEYAAWNKASKLYKTVFGQVKPYAVSGVVWYQGESDTTEAEARIYDSELELLVKEWRKDLRDDKLPFLVVQIADFELRNDNGWRGIQKAQERAVKKLSGAYLIRSRDVCESDAIHPPTKRKLAERIANVLKMSDLFFSMYK